MAQGGGGGTCAGDGTLGGMAHGGGGAIGCGSGGAAGGMAHWGGRATGCGADIGPDASSGATGGGGCGATNVAHGGGAWGGISGASERATGSGSGDSAAPWIASPTSRVGSGGIGAVHTDGSGAIGSGGAVGSGGIGAVHSDAGAGGAGAIGSGGIGAGGAGGTIGSGAAGGTGGAAGTAPANAWPQPMQNFCPAETSGVPQLGQNPNPVVISSLPLDSHGSAVTEARLGSFGGHQNGPRDHPS